MLGLVIVALSRSGIDLATQPKARTHEGRRPGGPTGLSPGDDRGRLSP
jgi:hypothetical protein